MNRGSFIHGSGLIGALLIPAAILAPAPALRAQAPDDDTYQGESPERYAQVKVVEGDVRLIKGDAEEALERGIPISEGDVLESHGRGVLQLGDGTRLAFAGSTRFQVAALFADRQGTREALLRLDYGRIRIASGDQSDARIRVDTPAGTATLNAGATMTCDVDGDRAVRVQVNSGRIVFANAADRATILAGERLTVYSTQDRLDRVREFNTYDRDAFDSWSDHYLVARHRQSWDRVPSEIRYYSDDLDDNGEWIQVEDVGWCWRPRGVAADWRPYWRGRWGCYPGGMTWVSDEPWGYVTYHHGRWGWGAGLGWYWIPGVFYSPAWVAWHSTDAYFGWAPLGYYNAPCSWGYGAWGGGFCWNVVNITFINAPHIHTRIYADINVIRPFGHGTAATTWSRGGNRPLTPPWQRGPLFVRTAEFRHPDPAQFQHVLQRDVARERMQVYERQAATSGRMILRRDPVATRAEGPSPRTPGSTARQAPFETPGRTRTAERPVLRDSRQDLPVDRPPVRTQEPQGRPAETPAPRPGRGTTADQPRTAPSRDTTRPGAEPPRDAPQRTEPSRPAPRETPRPTRQDTPRERLQEAPRERPARQEDRPAAPARREEARPSREAAPAPRKESKSEDHSSPHRG